MARLHTLNDEFPDEDEDELLINDGGGIARARARLFERPPHLVADVHW